MVVVTHEMEFARKVANWVVFMENGVIVEEGPAQEFFNHPKKERTLQFLHLESNDYDFSPVEILLIRFLIGYFVLWMICPKRLKMQNIRTEILF